MVQFTTIFSNLAKNISIRSGRKRRLDVGREAADTLAKEARKNEMMLISSVIVNANRTNNLVSAYSKRGKKGINQDCFIVWEEFGCQDDMIFCGIFDAHGPWGHLVAKTVRQLMPSFLLCNWQENLAQHLLKPDGDISESSDGCHCQFDIWKHSYFKTFSAIDYQLAQLPGIYSFYSGLTALTIIRQGDLIVVANVGDSWAVLATICDDDCLVPIQLTVDQKPNLPKERERITQSNGRIFSSQDEPGVYRIWMPNENTLEGPGLAISKAFGDYYIKDLGLISDLELTQRRITGKDQFAILATDGVWDVMSSQEAVDIVSSTPEREESAKRLVESGPCSWKCKRPGIAMDDITAICLFFHNSCPSQVLNPLKLSTKLA